jgi:hypothetical protein
MSEDVLLCRMRGVSQVTTNSLAHESRRSMSAGVLRATMPLSIGTQLIEFDSWGRHRFVLFRLIVINIDGQIFFFFFLK